MNQSVFFSSPPRRLGLGGVALLCGVLLAGCGGKKDGDASPDMAGVNNHITVEVMTARPAPFTDRYEVSAVAEPIRSFHLSAEVGGTLAELSADVGDRVVAGQVLARLDAEPLTLARETARARLDRATVSVSLARKAYARQQSLHKQGSIADSVLEEAELSVRLAEADRRLVELDLKSAERDLRHAEIIAPENGEITRRFPEVGGVLAAGSPVFHLSRTDRIRLVAGLSEREVVYIAEGVSAEVRFDALPDELIVARVVRVGSVDETGLATFPVEIHVDNADGRIRPGMVGRVSLAGRVIAAAVPVPAVALRRGKEGVGVFLVEEGDVSRRVVVSVAALKDEIALVDQGIPAGSQVVVVGQTALKGGEKVSIAVRDGIGTDDGRDAPPIYGLP